MGCWWSGYILYEGEWALAFIDGEVDQVAEFKEFTRANKPESGEASDMVFEEYEGME